MSNYREFAAARADYITSQRCSCSNRVETLRLHVIGIVPYVFLSQCLFTLAVLKALYGSLFYAATTGQANRDPDKQTKQMFRLNIQNYC